MHGMVSTAPRRRGVGWTIFAAVTAFAYNHGTLKELDRPQGRRRVSWQRTIPSASARSGRACGKALMGVRPGKGCASLSPWRVGYGRSRYTPRRLTRSSLGPIAACIVVRTTVLAGSGLVELRPT